MPPEIRATTAIAAGRGSYRSQFDIRPLEQVADEHSKVFGDLKNTESYRWGTIGGGGIPLRLESEKGQITLRKIKASTLEF